MKWYIASRMRHLDLVKSLSAVLEKQQQEISFKWFDLPSLKPYPEHQVECANYANEISTALAQTDIFILISDEAGTDMFIELGLFLGSNPKKIAYVVGPHNQRSLMHFHPNIITVDNLSDIFKISLREALAEVTILEKGLKL